MKKSMKHMEKKETPKMEAKAHSAKFLKTALSQKSLQTIRKKASKVMSAAGAAY